MEPTALSSPPTYPSVESVHKWWVLLAVGIGTFMTALDGSVVNITLPVVSAYFKSSITSVEWIITIYLLVISGVLLGFGRLGDIRGNKRVYIIGFGIFVASSALCGLAPSVLLLVCFRAVQALGGAMLAANSPAILTKSFSARQRGQALGMQATMTYLGLTVGPSLGGWLTDQFSWRAVFYINVPVGLVAFWLSAHFIRSDQPEEKNEPFDWLGALVFLAGLVALLLGLNQGSEFGWMSFTIITLLVGALVFLVLFIWIEKRNLHPMLDLSLFSNRLFSASVGSAILNYICVYSILFLMPFYLIQGRGLNPAQAGLLLTAMPVVMAVAAPISGTLSDRWGTRLPTLAGMAIMTIGLWMLSRLGPGTSFAQVVLALALSGLGIGVFISPNNSALMGSAPRQRQGIASGILATARNVGMVLGVGLAGAIFTSILAGQGNPYSASLYRAIQVSFLVSCGFSALGVLISAVKPKTINS